MLRLSYGLMAGFFLALSLLCYASPSSSYGTSDAFIPARQALILSSSSLSACPPLSGADASRSRLLPNCQCHWTSGGCEGALNQRYGNGGATYWTLDIDCGEGNEYWSGTGPWGGYCPTCWNCGDGCPVHNTGMSQPV